DASEWELLTQVAMGTSVARLAARSGTSEFEMASRVAAFVTRGLAFVGETTVRTPRPGGYEAVDRYTGLETGEDDPLGAEGPTGWTNELDALPATEDPDPEPPPPLIEGEVGYNADGEEVDDDGERTDFGLRGFAPRSSDREAVLDSDVD